MLKGVLLDLSGTVYVGDRLLPGVLDAIGRLGSAGLPVRYVTNSSRSSRRMVHDRLRKMGLAVDEELLFTAPRAVHDYLLRQRLRPWLLVHPDLVAEFADLPQQQPDAVVIGDAANAFDYACLNRAFRLLLEGAQLLAVGDNRYFLEADGMSLDAGPFVKALEYASGKQALILGKPSPDFFRAAVASLGCRPAEVLMVGDDVAADVNGARQAGLQAALVQSGKYRSGDERQLVDAKTLVCRDLPAVIDAIL